MKVFKLPDLGEGLPDAEVNQWHVKVGDTVKTDDLLVSMETAKAVVDVPSPTSGTITKLHGEVGDVINTGSPLVEFDGGETESAAPKTEDAGTVVGNVQVSDTVLEESAIGITPTKPVSTSQIKIIPAIRALARRLGVDLNTIVPTGPNGMITAEDVKAVKVAPKAVATATAAAPLTPLLGAKVEKIRGVRRAMITSMAQSHEQVVPVTLMDDADIAAWPKGTDITCRVLRAIVHACQTEPALNAWFDSNTGERHLFDFVNLGLAMDSGDGLFVPVIKSANQKSAEALRADINRFKDQVQARSIPQEDLKDATISISNFGTFAGRYANPIIVPPMVAIIGTGKIREQAVVADGKVVAHKVLPLSVTLDHRVVTGGEAARFLAAAIDDLQKPK